MRRARTPATHRWAHIRIESDGSLTLLDNAIGLMQDHVSVVPEPSSWALIAIGLAGVGVTAQQRAMAEKA